jgi:hypothetical protein
VLEKLLIKNYQNHKTRKGKIGKSIGKGPAILGRTYRGGGFMSKSKWSHNTVY